MIVELNAFDLLFASMYAERMHCGKDPATQSKKYSKDKSEWQLVYEGALGEVAVQKYTKCKLDLTVKKHGSNVEDTFIRGVSCQIKTLTFRGKDPDLYFDDESCLNAQAAVGCLLLSPVTVNVAGFMMKEEFMERCFVTNYGCGDRIAVKAAWLHPLEEIGK